VAQRIASDVQERLSILLELGWATCRSTAARRTLSPGDCSGWLATQVRSILFGVVYVLDEPSAGLHTGRYRGPALRR